MFILTIVPEALRRDNRDGNPSNRLAEIRGKITAAERRIRDLEFLLTQMILSPPEAVDGTDLPDITGATYLIDNPNDPSKKLRVADANQVRQQLYAARAYEGELRTAEQFWNQIVSANKEAEKDTHDLFKRS